MAQSVRGAVRSVPAVRCGEAVCVARPFEWLAQDFRECPAENTWYARVMLAADAGAEPLPDQGEVPQAVFQRMVGLRRRLHRFPELSGQETETARRICEELDALGVMYRSNVGGHGIVVDLPGKRSGPFVALRADMDALPITEETGLSFSSTRAGVMHACGHDGHTSMLLGALALLLERGPLALPVRLLWQPAEETVAGAQSLIDAGVLEDVAVIFGGHVDRHYPPGTLVVTEGSVNAATDLFEIDIQGQQGHGARPHEALDATVAGSLLVTSLQTIVSREIDPAHPSVITVGMFHAGEAPNVIAGRAHLAGTIRSQDQKVREHLERSITRIAQAIGQLHGAKVEVRVQHGTPPVINTADMVGLARKAAIAVVGEEQVTELHTPNMGGEDFAYYLDHVPGCYIRFGSQVPGRESHPAHSSRFDFHERSLATGAAWFAEVAAVAGEHFAKD